MASSRARCGTPRSSQRLRSISSLRPKSSSRCASRVAVRSAVERDQHDLLVVVERAAVEVRRADHRGVAVDGHDLGVHHRRAGSSRPGCRRRRAGRRPPRWPAGRPACRRAGRAAAGRPRPRVRRRAERLEEVVVRREVGGRDAQPLLRRACSITWNADCMSSQPSDAEPRAIWIVEPPRCGCSGNVSRSSYSARPVSAQFWMNADCRPSTAGPSTRRWVSRHSRLVARVAAPLLRDADAAGEADPSVDDADLAVQPVVGLERGLHQRLAEPLDLHPGSSIR